MLEADEIRVTHERMVGERSNHDGQWEEVADLILPRQSDFFSGKQEGANRVNQIFDPYGTQALDDGVSVFTSYVMPQGFQRIVAQEPELMKLRHVANWFEAKTNRLNFYRNDHRSGFAHECAESAASLLAFGNQGMTPDLRWDEATRRPVGLKYHSEHVGAVWIDEDWQGNVCRTHRNLRWTAKQCLGRWKEKLEAAPTIYAAAQDPAKAGNKFDIIHVIMPNRSYDHERADYLGKPFISGYYCVADKALIEVGGYGSLRLTYSRLNKSPSEKYGRGRGVDVLPTLKELQQVNVDLMVGAELSLMPTLGLHEDMLDQQMIYGARELVYGAIDSRGNKMVDKLFDVGDMNPALMIQSGLYAIIDKAFFRDLLDATKDLKSHVTDGQRLDRQQEKGVLLQPLARQMAEWFSPMNDTEFECMAMLGDFDDMPGEVVEAGGLKAILYDNPLTRSQKAEQVGGLFQLADKVAKLAPFDPSLVPLFNRMLPGKKWIPHIAEVLAVPSSLHATEDELAKAEVADEAEKQQQALLASMPPLAKAANDLSQAQANVSQS